MLTTQTLSTNTDDLLKLILLKNQEIQEEKTRSNELIKENKILSLRVQQLDELVRFLKGERFLSSSEKLSDEQLQLFNIEESEQSADSKAEKVVQSYTRKKGGRKKLPENLERIRIEHDIKPEDKQCPCGCGEMEKIGEEISEQLDIIPMQLKVIQNVRFKYACKKCEEGVFIAKMSPQILPKSNASPGLLAHVVTSKIADALPLYRQEQIFKRHGLDITRATLANWIVAVGEKVQPIVNLILDHLLDSSYIGMDETPFQVLKEEDRKAQSKSYMWIIRGGPPDNPATYFQYDPNRSQKVLKKIIEGFKGYLQSDAYQAYIGLDQNPHITLLGCFAHARRYFYRVIKSNGKNNPDSIAGQGIEWIRKLYSTENAIKNLSVEARYNARQTQSKPILEKMKTWLDEAIVKVPPKSLTGNALSYIANNWKYLIRYINDGRLSIDNNLTENAIRPFVVGRKNWLFCNTPEGALALANLFTLIETAKNNRINPYEYLRVLFHMLPQANVIEEFENLLPWNLKNILA